MMAGVKSLFFSISTVNVTRNIVLSVKNIVSVQLQKTNFVFSFFFLLFLNLHFEQ